MELFKAEREEVLILLERVSEAQRLATMQMKESEGNTRGGGRKRRTDGDDDGGRGDSRAGGGRGGGGRGGGGAGRGGKQQRR